MIPDEKNLTPMMKQYLQVKSEAPKDSILLFRLGDFYEMFYDDARKASQILEIVLTKRAGYPMCGIPYHAIDNYLPKLLDAGVKVAIAEQLEDPALAKGIVKRNITRVITPGTVIDSAVLNPRKNNFLCALTAGRDRYGFSWLDISTGEFKAAESAELAEIESLLYSLQTRECLLPASIHEQWEKDGTFPFTRGNVLWTPLDDWIFSTENTTELLKRQFNVMTLDGFGLRNCPLAVRAAGAILYYAEENLRHNTGHLRTITLYSPEEYLSLDPICQRNLELVEPMFGSGRENTLLHVLDRTGTPMGGRLLRNWLLKPLRNVDRIIERQDVVALFKDDPLTLAELRETLSAVRDLERIVGRLNVGTANPRDLLTLAHSLEMLPAVRLLLQSSDLPLVERLRERICVMPELTDQLLRAIADEPPVSVADGGVIRAGFDPDLDTLRSAATDGRKWVAELQAKEQERTGIKTLKVNYNRVFGYFIEVTKSHLANVPEDYVRKQTLVNAERFITPELKEMESKILGAEDKALALEAELFAKLRDYARTFTVQIQQTAAALAEIDVLGALADCASRYAYVRPRVNDSDVIDIKAGRHPVLDCAMQNERFVPNDTLLDGDENRMMIITGPNMAGKSTYIRQTALLVIMAQMGSFIPAASAVIGTADKIFTRVGASDDLARGQSTFMVEMVETANILNNATSRSLVILDEIGRGTSTFDGLSIAWAVAEFLLDHPACRARTQFATHYHELTELALTRRGVRNYNVAVREYGEQIIFLRQIVPGAADKSYGIHVAKLAGLPAEVISRAKDILENLENNSIAEAGQPALVTGGRKNAIRENRRPYRKKDQDPPDLPLQPSLFDL
ncbi:MAG: DNA mismatch repair protein MutS [Lentisphaeria bacterium]|nr:DNA mismatch repair protein MutS [Lentisphaeria bacterium]